MSVGLYHRYLSLFEAILKENKESIIETLLFFKNMAKKNDDLIKKAESWGLSHWLAYPCILSKIK